MKFIKVMFSVFFMCFLLNHSLYNSVKSISIIDNEIILEDGYGKHLFNWELLPE